MSEDGLVSGLRTGHENHLGLGAAVSSEDIVTGI